MSAEQPRGGITPERRDDYTMVLTVWFSQRTEAEMDQVIDGLKAFVDAGISPITGAWTLNTDRPIREDEWRNVRGITKRSWWTCESCNRSGKPGELALLQRHGQSKRQVCQACAEKPAAVQAAPVLAATVAERSAGE